MAATKFYVVWKGRRRGIFSSWSECEKQVSGYVGARFKAFETLEQARKALAGSYEQYEGKDASAGKWRAARTKPQVPSVCVDAACSGSPGTLEYRGVLTDSGQHVFRAGPFADGTNNVGEFLAIVDAIRWLHRHRRDWPIYSDSTNAIGWVRAKRCGTRLRRTPSNRPLFDMISDAEADLRAVPADGRSPSPGPRILKWHTAEWGEIPADFGRK